jgi:hypothetical protein
MSIGTGIFLGALSISIVLLYGATKDRWHWRKIAKQSGFGFAALLVFLLFAGISTYIAQSRWPRNPRSSGLRPPVPRFDLRRARRRPSRSTKPIMDRSLAASWTRRQRSYVRQCMPPEIRPHIGAAPSAGLADETRLRVVQSDIIRPSVPGDRGPMAAAIVRAIDQ